MKLISSLHICKGFAMCRGHITANDQYEYTERETSEDTRFSQIFYLLEGSGIAPDGNFYKDKLLMDMRDYFQKQYKFIAGNNGATWLCINPIPANKFFDAEILNTPTTIVGDGREHIIICAKGTIFANDKELKQFNYVRVLNEKTANISFSEDSEAIYLKR